MKLYFNDHIKIIRTIIARTNNSELKKKLLPPDDNWKINDYYSKFINRNISELNAILKKLKINQSKCL